MRMSFQSTIHNTICVFISGQFPHNDRFVCQTIDFGNKPLLIIYYANFKIIPTCKNCFSNSITNQHNLEIYACLTRSLQKTRILVFSNCYLPAENENSRFAVTFFHCASFFIVFYVESTLTA